MKIENLAQDLLPSQVQLESQFGGEAFAAQFRGYTEINRTLKARIVAGKWQLGQYLGEASPEPSPAGVLALLGTYVGSDIHAEFRNGDPNSLNATLWYVALSGFASQLATSLTTDSNENLKLRPEFVESAKPILSWPSSESKEESVLRGFWQSLLKYDAPDEDFESWKKFFLTNPTFTNASPTVVISAMVLSALYNPYFLLEA